MNIRKQGEVLKLGWNWADSGSYRIHLTFRGEVNGEVFHINAAFEREDPTNPEKWTVGDIEWKKDKVDIIEEKA